MPDHAVSTDPAVQRQLDRLSALSPGADILGLERIAHLLDRVGNPQRRLPPVFHVAGTNGKGSTCAFLRAAVEASGRTAHVYSSPHLVRFNERIRLAGLLIEDGALAALLEEVLDAGGDVGASFFEVTTAAAFLAFARTPADACIVEVGLGGRLDATNVIQRPAVTGIAQLGIDHQAFLGDTLEAIAAEKAGIAKPGVPLVTMRYPPEIAAVVGRIARERGAALFAEGDAWSFEAADDGVRYRDRRGGVSLPLPALAGAHQPANLALAVAMLRHQQAVPVPNAALTAGSQAARWPARMQRLSAGPLRALLPDSAELWLDGGHNANAADAVAGAAVTAARGRPIHLVLGMLENKDAQAMIGRFAPYAASLTAVPILGHPHHAPAHLAALANAAGLGARAAADVPAALAALARQSADSFVLVLGSLYLAGTVLQANDELPS